MYFDNYKIETENLHTIMQSVFVYFEIFQQMTYQEPHALLLSHYGPTSPTHSLLKPQLQAAQLLFPHVLVSHL